MKLQFDLSKVDFRVTPIENIFLETYLTSAPENALKVYLYGWMRAYKNEGESIEAEELSKALGLNSEQLVDALSFWMDRGMIKEDSEDGHIKFKFISMLLLYSGFYDDKIANTDCFVSENDHKEIESNEVGFEKSNISLETQEMFDGLENFLSEGRSYRVELKANEIRQALDLLEKYPIDPKFFLYAYKKAAINKEASSRSFNYLTAIVENWIRFENISSEEALDSFLEKEQEKKNENKKACNNQARKKGISTSRKESKEEDRAWVKAALERSRKKSLRGDGNAGK